MITDALGWKLDKFEQDMEPIVTDVDRKSQRFAAAGHAGVAMWRGAVDGQVKIEIWTSTVTAIRPGGGGSTGDMWAFRAFPRSTWSIPPEIEAGIGTMAAIMNCIPT